MINKSIDMNCGGHNFKTISQPVTPLHENNSTQNFTMSRDQTIETGEDGDKLITFEYQQNALEFL